MKNIALIIAGVKMIKPTFREYPLGVGYIGTILKQNNFNIKIIDQALENIDNQELIEMLMDFNVDIIGFSVVSSSYENTIKMIGDIRKSALKNSIILGGGIHVSLYPEDSLKDGFDIIVRGESESKILDVVNNVSDVDKLKEIHGISFKDRHSKIYYNKDDPNKYIPIEELPIIDRSIYNMDLYTHHSISTTRGCPHQCKFCCNYSNNFLIYNKKPKSRTVDNVLKEIYYLKENFDLKNIYFVDDIFFLSKKNIKEFCIQIVKQKLIFNWYIQLRVDYVDDDIAKVLKESNCSQVFLGVESGSEEILKNIKKNINRKDIINSIRILKENDIKVKTGWIFGLPGDIEEQRKSISLMLESKPNYISIHKLIPFPGTEYFNNAKKYGININDNDFSNFNFCNNDESIAFEYLDTIDYQNLLLETVQALKNIGYVSSDEAKGDEEYIFSTHLSIKTISSV